MKTTKKESKSPAPKVKKAKPADRLKELFLLARQKQIAPIRTKVNIVESERGWGQKIDSEFYFDKKEDAEEFVKLYNARNTEDKVPEYYTYAEIAWEILDISPRRV